MSDRAAVQTQTAVRPTITPVVGDLLQRAAINNSHAPEVPPIVHEVLRSPGQPLDATTRAFMEPRFSHDFSSVRISKITPSTVQTKLRVGPARDTYEEEADRIADTISRTPESRDRCDNSASPSVVQNQNLEVRRQEIPGNDGQSNRAGSTHDSQAMYGNGQALAAPIQTYFETRFGHNFGNVRIHTDARAAALAQALNARAFTIGNHVVFGVGEYAPTTQTGKRVLAHELTHVVQQSRALPGERFVQRLSYAEIKEKAYTGLVSGIRAAKNAWLGELRKAVSSLPSSFQGFANTLIDIDEAILDILISLVLGVIGIVVGFVEGIVGLIKGLISLIYGVGKLLFDLIYGIFVNFDRFKQDIAAIVSALKNLPGALKKLVEDWLDRFKKASPERQSLIIGELTGQVLALIATYAVLVGRAGTASEVAAAGAEAEAGAAGGVAEMASAGARTAPTLALLEGGGGSAASTAASAGGETVGNLALKAAPVIEEAPQVAPLRLVPPLPAEIPAVAPVAEEATAAATTVSTGTKIASGAVVASATAAKLADESKKPASENLMRFQVQWNTGKGGPTFSEIAGAPKNPGVTTTQAVTALTAAIAKVTPRAAQNATAPAAVKQTKWILSRPPAGIAIGGYSKSEYFPYKGYTDARVDVENIRGHNLKV